MKNADLCRSWLSGSWLHVLLVLLTVVTLTGFSLETAEAQQRGGVLRITHRDSPSSMSIHEEGTISVVLPMMGVFNNLVLFDQHARQNSLDGIVPDLATGWTWSEDGKKLTFALQKGVTWHDGKPFTAADVKCTWDLLAGKARENFKVNFRKGWYANVEGVTVTGDHEAVFNLKAAATSAAGVARIRASRRFTHAMFPRVRCASHQSEPDRSSSSEYNGNQGIKVVRNPNYWKPNLPYLDGIEYTIIPNRSTAILAFVAGRFDMIFPYELTVPAGRGRQEPDARSHLRYFPHERGGERADESGAAVR